MHPSCARSASSACHHGDHFSISSAACRTAWRAATTVPVFATSDSFATFQQALAACNCLLRPYDARHAALARDTPKESQTRRHMCEPTLCSSCFYSTQPMM